MPLLYVNALSQGEKKLDHPVLYLFFYEVNLKA